MHLDLGLGLGIGRKRRGAAVSLPWMNTLSAQFDGVDEHIILPQGGNWDFVPGQSFTLSLWIKGGAANDTVMAKAAGATSAGWVLYFLGTTLIFALRDSTGVSKAAAFVVGSGWHHVCVVYDHTTPQVIGYLDGVLVGGSATDAWGGNFANTERPMIGEPITGYNYFSGKVDELSLFDVVLNLTEIQEIYNSGDPADLSLHSRAADLVDWRRMGDLASVPGLYIPNAATGQSPIAYRYYRLRKLTLTTGLNKRLHTFRGIMGAVDILPENMTNNNTPSPYVASSVDDPSDAWKAFDGDGGTDVGYANSIGGWTKIDLGSAAALAGIWVRAWGGGRSPGALGLQGSNDDSDWTELGLADLNTTEEAGRLFAVNDVAVLQNMDGTNFVGDVP